MALDRRLHAFRPNLADKRLEGQVEAERFVEAMTAHVIAPVTKVHTFPDANSGMDTQFLYGDELRVFDRNNGWAWVQSQRDSYVGYVPEGDLDEGVAQATHFVCTPRSFLYPEPDLKKPAIRQHSMGARVAVVSETEIRGTRYALLDDGRAMIARHLRPLDKPAKDYVAVAELFLHTPYLWGGTSGFGIDCSGLVQLSMLMAGHHVPRDTDMQINAIGTECDPLDPLKQHGDLIFWRGHVAIMTSTTEIIHANGHTMSVVKEPLTEAIQRIELLYGRPTAMRRPA